MGESTVVPRTMMDIANMLGISKVSVSLALRNSPTISPELRSRVQQIARETGFKARNYQKRAGKKLQAGLGCGLRPRRELAALLRRKPTLQQPGGGGG